MDTEARGTPVDWGMPDTSNGVHPIYFAKHMSKAISMDYDRRMDYPSNGVSILGCLRPDFLDEESYIRRLFLSEDNWEVQGDDNASASSRHDKNDMSSSLCRLEIVGIELLSLYGTESSISLQDFQDAEPDILVHSISAIIERFNNRGISSGIALKTLCKKRGLHAEEANLISVDSLGMDVRVFAGAQVHTHRFPFKTRATAEMAAEEKNPPATVPSFTEKETEVERREFEGRIPLIKSPNQKNVNREGAYLPLDLSGAYRSSLL